MSPTTRAFQLRLPASCNEWVERRRVTHTDSRDQRRQWTLEALAVSLFVIMFPIVVLYFNSDGFSLRSALWLLGPLTAAIIWYSAICGRARAAATLAYPLILAETTFGTYQGAATVEQAGNQFFSVALVMVLAALTETSKRTFFFGALAFAAVMYTCFAQLNVGGRVAMSVSFVLALLLVVAMTSAWVNQAMFDRTEYELSRNRALAAELEQRVLERTRQLQELSERDELTGLLNRRYFMGQLESLRSAQSSVSMLMIDVDHFKAVNDTFGHNTGDEVLRRVADTLRGLVRGGDVLARLGGEEFAVLLPGVDGSTAAGVADRIRAEIAALTWTQVRVPDSQVTVSVGISCAELRTSDDVEELMQSADAGLYSAKRSGRNRVRAATNPPRPRRESGSVSNDEQLDRLAIRQRWQSLAD